MVARKIQEVTAMARPLYGIYVWLVFLPLVVLATVVLGVLALLLAPVLGPAATGRITAVPWARFGLFLSGVRVDVRGAEHIDPRQSYVVAANHLSHIDIWVLYGYLGMDIRWVAKKEVRRIPVLGIACVALGHVFIDRSNHERALASLDQAKARIRHGTSIIFFPEGTRSRSGELQPFKKGAFRMAMDLDLPVLPVTISGTRALLTPDTARLTPGHARLVIHPPVLAEGTDNEALAELMRKSRAAISADLNPPQGIGGMEHS
jgi:1-acyl-sn-glycerol-3-phosphate acyltransferase